MVRKKTPLRFIWTEEDEEGIRLLKPGAPPEPDIPEPKEVPAPKQPRKPKPKQPRREG
jgi:hypothetical protein